MKEERQAIAMDNSRSTYRSMHSRRHGGRAPGLRLQDFEGPIYHETEGFVIAEAEGCSLSSNWKLRTDQGGDNEGGCVNGSGGRPEGGDDGKPREYRGSGYMRWEGGSQGVGHHAADNQQYQGDRDDWMVVRLFITNPGRYSVDLRCFHQERDGDNDCWIGKIGQDTLIYKFGACHVKQYSWHDWDPDKANYYLEEGHQAVYVSGRSNGMGIDRIAVWKHQDEALFQSSHDPDASPTALYGASPVIGATAQSATSKRSAQWRVVAVNQANINELLSQGNVYDLRGRAVSNSALKHKADMQTGQAVLISGAQAR